MTDLALLAAVLGLASLVRVRIEGTSLTAPMLFVLAGLILGPSALGAFDLGLEDESVALLAELTLALLLFADATRIDIAALRRFVGLPVRLLGIGLPLTIALGTLVTHLLLPDLSWAEAGLVAAVLAPTDAALGEAVVGNMNVPVRIRQALNVESGLNDGLAVPAITVLLAVAAGSAVEGPGTVVGEAFAEIAIGVAFGAAVAVLMAKLVPWLERSGWTDGEGFRLLAFSTALGAFAGANVLGGNGFLAAFTAGLVVRAVIGASMDAHIELVEDVGQLAASTTFVIFGALLLWPAVEMASPLIVLCAIGTLTMGRMVPVWIATRGTGLKLPTVAFLGWFGPRGLASMVFGLLILGEPGVNRPDDLFSVIVLVIAASVFLHGLSAGPGARRYASWFAAHGVMMDDMAEGQVVPEGRMRGQRDMELPPDDLHQST